MAARSSAVSRRAGRITDALGALHGPGAALAALGALLPAVAVVALGTGPIAIAPGDVLATLLEAAGLAVADHPDAALHSTVILSIRLPRILLGVLVGCAMATAGAVLQGFFRNPLAEPGLIGVSGGAAFAAACAIVLGAELGGLLGPLRGAAVPVAAFAGGFVVTLLVYKLGTHSGRTNVTIMLLAGVAVQALAVSGLGFMQYLADDNELRDLTFWTLGSLGGATWRELALTAPWIVGAMLAMPLLSRALNALLLGEAEARHLGFNVERTKRVVVVSAAIAVGASVSAAGIIAFVGLIVPHVVRLVTGPDHRFVLPGSMLLGAMLLIGADAVARTVASPAELPIGILFALLGTPFFVYLLYRGRRHGTI